MPRASRCFAPGLAWHLTHRCHDRKFLLRAAVDRDRWRRWLFEATARYGLSVLNFVVTSNHVHLLVYDDGNDGRIARSMRLLQGCTAQAYNRRRGRIGAFWQDRYHAVAIDSCEYLWRCLVYIDLNMVRAGVVGHPRDWRHGGYNEIQSPRSRYRVLDLGALAALTECSSLPELQAAHREQVEVALSGGPGERDSRWTEALAVGSETFVKSVQAHLGLSSLQRRVTDDDVEFVLREGRPSYANKARADFSR